MNKEELLDLVEQLQQANEELTKQNWQLERCFNKCKNELDEYEDVIDEAIRYIKAEGISFLNIAGQRTWCGKHSGDKILEILERGKE